MIISEEGPSVEDFNSDRSSFGTAKDDLKTDEDDLKIESS